ncbi:MULTISPECIES: GbsR/MarR family transcriptional regulator [Emticicia]|uniref:GbsR/MarR family transcriptional regulator n=1 Tax=Emticicia TaxID=312278 RepID=UPI00209DF0D8|nr:MULTISPECIES: MarR family transcriptional regulator [Emticicia]UTA70074.1 MarR family transcriptional regulator [Emticicia sp. 21SJ11W-3]
MDSLKLSDEKLALIEKVGLMFEQGLQPAAARIAALLLVSDRLELTFDEICEALNLSKSATSNAINLLLNMNRIEYITKPGDRKRYFKSNLSDWKETMKAKFLDFDKVNNIMREVLDQRPHATKEFNQKLEEFIQFMEFMGREIPALFKKWEQSKK